AAIAAWPEAEPDMALRQKALVAELEPANWHEEVDAEGKPGLILRYPADLAAEIEALRPVQPATLNLRAVLNRFEGMLGMTIADEDASQVYLLLDDENGLEEFPE
ncbi:hypothetical protein LXJ59_26985, partial [Escherichia coli]|nr:hypothetical protein [Escherichia coli]